MGTRVTQYDVGAKGHVTSLMRHNFPFLLITGNGNVT